eukprot:3129812-Ditylum_brightwellii.AAC.1
MEATLRKLVNRLRKKVEERSDAVVQKGNAVATSTTGTTNNQDSNHDWHVNKIAEIDVPIGLIPDESGIKSNNDDK